MKLTTEADRIKSFVLVDRLYANNAASGQAREDTCALGGGDYDP